MQGPVFYGTSWGDEPAVVRYGAHADVDWLAIELGHRAADILRGYGVGASIATAPRNELGEHPETFV